MSLPIYDFEFTLNGATYKSPLTKELMDELDIMARDIIDNAMEKLNQTFDAESPNEWSAFIYEEQGKRLVEAAHAIRTMYIT